MLPSSLVDIWLGASAIRANLRALSGKDIALSWQTFQQFAGLQSEQLRATLADTDESRNRNIAICLLGKALDEFEGNADGDAIALTEWATFVAQYGAAFKNRRDLIEADAAFLKAAAHHRQNASGEVWRVYSEAEQLYRAAAATPLLIAVSLLAQGWVALEVGLAERVNQSYGGAQELFARALSTLAIDSPQRGAFEQMILRGKAQSDSIDAAIQTSQPLAALRAANTEVDENLMTMLQTRALAYAFQPSRENHAIILARLTDQLLETKAPAETRLKLAGIFMERKRAALSEMVYREVLRESSNDPALMQRLAHALETQGNTAEAVSLLKQVAKLQPDSADSHGILGMLLWQCGDQQGAAEHLGRSLELDPSNTFYAGVLKTIPAVTVEMHGKNIVIGGDIKAAGPDELAAGIMVAFLSENPGLIAESLAALDQTNPPLAARVRAALVQRGLVESPPVPESAAHLAAAESYFAKQCWDEAIKEYRLALTADEDLADAYTGLGDVHYRIGEYYVSAAYFEESLEIRDDAPTLRFLGDSYLNTGRKKRAADSYRKALALQPDYHGARVALQQLESQEPNL
jgi:tetratricopeptide (TPR) repeat protein